MGVMRMRINIVLHHAEMSGGARVVAIHAQQLMKRGHDVTVVSTPLPPPGWRDVARSLVRDRRMPAETVLGPSHLDGTGVPHRVIERYRPVADDDLPDADIVMATWWRTAPWVAALSPAKGIKCHLVQHYEDWGLGESTIADVDAAYRLPLFKICVSQWLAEMMRTKFGCRDAACVFNGVDLEQFQTPPREKRPAPTVGMLYSPQPFKGCRWTMQAVEMARREIADLQLVAFGNEDPLDDLLPPQGTRFYRHPPQERIGDIYSACDAWLVGSRSEGFGLPILEAMACRTPVISTPVGAAPELVIGGGGSLVEFEDVSAMAQQIVRYITMSSAQWRECSDLAFAVASGHSWSRSVDEMERVLLDKIARACPVREAAESCK
jgi:glycosyltransferase involved in cell wall biosynthesis